MEVVQFTRCTNERVQSVYRAVNKTFPDGVRGNSQTPKGPKVKRKIFLETPQELTSHFFILYGNLSAQRTNGRLLWTLSWTICLGTVARQQAETPGVHIHKTFNLTTGRTPEELSKFQLRVSQSCWDQILQATGISFKLGERAGSTLLLLMTSSFIKLWLAVFDLAHFWSLETE